MGPDHAELRPSLRRRVTATRRERELRGGNANAPLNQAGSCSQRRSTARGWASRLLGYLLPKLNPADAFAPPPALAPPFVLELLDTLSLGGVTLTVALAPLATPALAFASSFG